MCEMDRGVFVFVFFFVLILFHFGNDEEKCMMSSTMAAYGSVNW